MTPIELWLRDLDASLVVRRCVTTASARTSIAAPEFTTPRDVEQSLVAHVRPANSFGFMDGGIDAVYTHQFGPGVQERLQR